MVNCFLCHPVDCNHWVRIVWGQKTVNNPAWIYDIECYRNYFLVLFLNTDTGEWQYYEKFNDVESWPLIIPQGLLIGFNSRNYDHPMLDAAVNGVSNDGLKRLSDEIILSRKMWWQHSDLGYLDQIDIIEVLPGQASLKIYGGRNGSARLQDLPLPPDAIIKPEQVAVLRHYCLNDDVVTLDLYKALKDQIALRVTMGQQYGMDLRSKSDAQIAEAVIVSEYEKLTGSRVTKGSPDALVGRKYRYQAPDYMQFQTPYLQELLKEVLETDFVVSDKGAITIPVNLAKKVIDVGGTKYQMGIGGIHSKDKPGSFYASADMLLEDIDVESYYPKIIINNGFTPAQMSDGFQQIYSSIVERRLAAKKAGDKVTADSLKIVINGSFGKLGSKYSKLYAPNLLIQTTITGQLSLLMLIEYFGSRVISANTDGILLHYKKEEREWVREVVSWWESITQYRMEYTPYKSYHRRDVNNYLAIKENDSKGKGCFKETDLGKNPANEVIYKAVIARFVDGTEIDTFIRNHKVVVDFTSLRTVRGGAVKNGVPYGKSVRWYWSTKQRTSIYYQTSGNIVPTTERSGMMMDLPPTLPDDLDYDRYIKEATELYEKIK